MAQAPSRPSRLRRLAAVFLLGGLVLLVLSSAWGAGLPSRPATGGRAHALGSTGSPGGGSTGVANLTVNLTDGPSFDPHNLLAVAGNALTFHLHDTGSLNHSFTISASAGVVLAHNLTPTQLTNFLSTNGTLVDVSLTAGQSLTVNYSVPSDAAGKSFEIVSRVAYQFQAGMFGFFNVTGGRSGAAVELNETTVDALQFVPAALNDSGASGFPAALAIDVTNLGGTAHTFTVAAQPNVSLDPGSFSSYFTSHPPAVNVNVPSGSGSAVWANFTIPGPGVYEYICEVPGHFANGMFGFLYVGVPVPTVAAPLSTAIVQPELLAGAGILLGIGALLALAGSFTGRFPRQPPASGHS